MWRCIILLGFTVILMGCEKIQTSQNAAPHQMHHSDDTVGRSEFPRSRSTTGHKVFIFDPKIPAWAIYDRHGERIKTGRASGGKGYCPDIKRSCRTVRGSFRVHAKRGPNCVSNKFPLGEGGAPMPHCMFFHGGYAIHGSYHVPRYNASHGCIRVLPSAAQWLSDNFMDYGTQVIVKPY